VNQKFGSHHLQQGQIRCRCGKIGSIVWEDAPAAEGVRQELVKLDGDFYERLSKRPPYPVELVCNTCGTAQVGPVQP
jgi:hypothetical protein